MLLILTVEGGVLGPFVSCETSEPYHSIDSRVCFLDGLKHVIERIFWMRRTQVVKKLTMKKAYEVTMETHKAGKATVTQAWKSKVRRVQFSNQMLFFFYLGTYLVFR